MLGVDSWLDVAPLENMEGDHSFLFMKKNLMKIFFFFLNLENLNFSKELKILDFFFFLKKFGNPEFFWRNWKFWLLIFSFLKQPKKYEPNALSPKAFFENLLLFFFLKILEILNFFMELKFLIDDFFLKNLEILNFFKELKSLNFFFFFKET